MVTGTFADLDPEWEQYLPTNPGLGSQDKKKRRREQKDVSSTSALRRPEVCNLAEMKADTEEYWKSSLALVNAWADYQKVKYLLINYTHDETRHKVEKVVERYWGGSEKKLQETEEYRSSVVNFTLVAYEDICTKVGVEPVSRDWLYHNLVEATDYTRLRGKICRRAARLVAPESLKNL